MKLAKGTKVVDVDRSGNSLIAIFNRGKVTNWLIITKDGKTKRPRIVYSQPQGGGITCEVCYTVHDEKGNSVTRCYDIDCSKAPKRKPKPKFR